MKGSPLAPRGLLAATAWLFLAAPAWAEDDPPEVRVARLIRQLGSVSYPERTQAHAELAALGGASREQLTAALRHNDAEVRLRAKELLHRLKIADLWNASRVTLDLDNQPVSRGLAKVAEQTGNRLLMGDQYGNYQEKNVTLKTDAADFWIVVDRLCAVSGNRVRPHYDSRQPGLVVIAGKPSKYPTAYSGPVRALVTNAQRSFKEELDYEDLSSDVSHSFQMNLQLMWEDRFRLVAYRSQLELVEARTDEGDDLNMVQTAASSWNVATGGTRQVTMSLRLHPPSTQARRLDSLKLRWGLIAVGDMATMEITELTSNQPHFADDVELSVESCQATAGGRCELTLSVLRGLVLPDPQDVFFQENDVELLDQRGQAFRKQSQSNSFADSAAKLKISFAGESSDSQPTRLRFHYPRIRAARELELSFKDVPLPIGKPE